MAVSRDSMSYNFVLQVGKDFTEHNLKETVYSFFILFQLLILFKNGNDSGGIPGFRGCQGFFCEMK